MGTYEEIFENNRQWVQNQKERDPEFFEKLAEGQEPEFMFIGCADSRVPASTIMGLEPGEVFVHRNIANLVVNTDVSSHAVLHYAVDHLQVDHLVVCGHYGCGGVASALESRDLGGMLNGWLREIRDVYRQHQEELEAIDDPEQRRRRLVELNVRQQCKNLIKTATVQRNYLKRGAPRVHGWVYSLSTGHLHDLEIPFEELLEEVRQVYRLSLDEETSSDTGDDAG